MTRGPAPASLARAGAAEGEQSTDGAEAREVQRSPLPAHLERCVTSQPAGRRLQAARLPPPLDPSSSLPDFILFSFLSTRSVEGR